MRTLDRYLAREVGLNWLAVAVVLMLILVSGGLAQLLARAAEGDLPTDLVGRLLLVDSLRFFYWILPLAAFLGVILALGRLYRDSEMAVMIASGVSPVGLLRAVMGVALPVAALSALLAFWLVPAVEAERAALEADAEARAELAVITPGRFLSGRDGRAVLYVESVGPEGLANVFIYTRTGDGEPAVEVARQGRLVTDPESGQRMIELLDGHRYQGLPGETRFRIWDFDAHTVGIPGSEPPPPEIEARAMTTTELLGTGGDAVEAELHWRIAQPLSVLLLALLAVPLSHTEPRGGRAGRMTAALLIYLTYSNLLAAGRAWVEDGVVDAWTGMWSLHLALLVLGGLLLWRRSGGRLPALPRGRAA